MRELRPDDTEQRRLIGRALERLRGLAGMTLQEAATELARRLGRERMSKQGWHPYELGERKFSGDRLAMMLAVLDADEEDLWQQVERLKSVRAGSLVRSGVGGQVREEGAAPFLIQLRGRVGTGFQPSQEAHDAAFSIDLRSYLGPNVRYTIQAGDQVSGYLESGSPVFYDLLLWPIPGRGCVVEYKTGELMIGLYERDDGSTIFVRTLKPEPRTHALPRRDLAGVYKVILRGD